MSTPAGMSCESCRDLLVELVCDELSPEIAADVRAHALKCERCGPELEKLSATLRASRELPLLTPSPEVALRIMQAARDAMPGRARGPAREASSPVTSGLTAWFARLGSFAMSPQVAMASVLLLVVGIGLYALPLGQAPEHAALRATEDESDSVGSAPSPAASAASAPIAEENQRQGAARANEPPTLAQDKNGKHAAAGSPVSELESKKQGSQPAERGLGASKPKAKAGSSGRARTLEGLDDAFGAAPDERRAAPEPKTAVQPLQLDPRKEASKLQAPARDESRASADYARASDGFAPAPPAAAAPRPSKQSVPSNVGGPKDSEPAQAPLAQSSSPKGGGEGLSARAPARVSSSASPSTLEQGIAAARRGDHKLAEALLTPIASGGVASERGEASLWLARSLRERGDCARALTYYRVLTQAVTAPRAVLEEAADCHQRTGNEAIAAKLRARAALPGKP